MTLNNRSTKLTAESSWHLREITAKKAKTMSDDRKKDAAARVTRRRIMTGAAAVGAAHILSGTGVSAQETQGTVLVTGSNRGIGLRLARIYAERGWTVIATCRRPEAADDLKALRDEHPNLSIERLDVTDDKQIADLAAKLEGQPIDVLLNNAAILGAPDGQDFGSYDFDTFRQIMDVNVAGPLKVSQAFIDNVERSERKKIVAITSGQGSIAMSRGGSIVFYNMSKSALNMAMSSLAKDLKRRGVIVALISPGAVDTDMMALALEGADARFTLLTPEQSAKMVMDMIDRHDLDMSGKFMAHDGQEYPW